MKKFIYTIIAMLGILMPTSAWAQSTSGDEGSYREAYAVLEVTAADDGSITDAWITLYYDDLKSTRKGTVVDLDKMLESPEIMQTRQQLHSVIIDQSFAECRPTSTAGWFGYCFELKTIAGLEYLNTSEVTDMTGMFMECGVDKLNLSNFNTSKVTTMNNMFAMCRELVGVDISSFDTSNVTDMSFMFGGCSSLTTIIAGDKWSTDKVTEGDYMFGECTSIVGGNGTTYDENHIDPSYARIDKEGQPGYFTGNNAEPILNDGDLFTDETIEGVTLTYRVISAADKTCQVGGGESDIKACDVNTTGTVTVPEVAKGFQVITVGGYAFYGCSKLTQITLPETIKTITYFAFADCSGLTFFTIPSSVTRFDGNHQWNGCTGLTSIHIPANVSSMGNHTFANCPNILEVTVDENNRVFESPAGSHAIINKGKKSLVQGFKNTVIPEGITYIESAAFVGNEYSDIVLPKSFEGFYWDAFQHNAVRSITVAEGNTLFDSRNNCNALMETATDKLVKGCANTVIPSETKVIGEWAFAYSDFNVNDYPSLKTVVLPEGLTKIENWAFGNCKDLEEVTIPSTVTEIMYNAFVYSDNMKTIVSYIQEPFALGDAVFDDTQCRNIILYVPQGTKSLYEATDGWKELKNIVEMNSTSGKVETPTFSFSGDSLVISTTTEDALIWYQSAAIDSTFEDGFAQYSGPIVIGDVKMNAKATKDGMEDSEVASMVYYYTEWQELMETTYECEALLTQIEASNPSDEILEMIRSLYTEIAYVRDVYDRDRLSWDRDKISEEISKLKVGASEIEAKWREQQVDVTYADCTLTVGGNTTMDAALEQVGGRAEVAKTIAAIVWNSTEPLTKSDLDGLIDNPNLLIYVKADSLAPEGVNNVIIDGKLKELVLVDADGNNNFSAPQTFTVENISYTREFKQTTEKDVSRGWEGICLPFDVQTYTHETHGAIAPFRSNASEFHFWLHEMTENGMVLSTGIEANKPYIISMPNNITYPATYNQAGKVTFAAKNVTIERSEAWMIHNSDGSIGVAGIYFNLEKNASYYALNVGEEVEGNPEGSVFVSNYRDIHPFEVFTYHTGRNARSNIISLSSLLGGKDGTTGIIDIMENQNSDVVKVYSINGTLIKKGNRSDVMNGLPKGLYIIGNQKVMVK